MRSPVPRNLPANLKLEPPRPARQTLGKTPSTRSGLTVPLGEIAEQQSSDPRQATRANLRRDQQQPKAAAPGKFRPNVAACVINPQGEVLLIWHREHHRRSWQFPQGGIKTGESIRGTLRCELREELGLTDFEVVSIQENVYRYRWPEWLVRTGSDPDKRGFIGQVQSLAIVRVPVARPKLAPDPREANRTKWVPLRELERSMGPVRRKLARLAVVQLQQLGLLAAAPGAARKRQELAARSPHTNHGTRQVRTLTNR